MTVNPEGTKPLQTVYALYILAPPGLLDLLQLFFFNLLCLERRLSRVINTLESITC